MIYIQHLTICDLCQRTDFQKYSYVIKDVPCIPEIPDGWRYLHHRLICTAHQVAVEIRVDGKVWPG